MKISQIFHSLTEEEWEKIYSTLPFTVFLCHSLRESKLFFFFSFSQSSKNFHLLETILELNINDACMYYLNITRELENIWIQEILDSRNHRRRKLFIRSFHPELLASDVKSHDWTSTAWEVYHMESLYIAHSCNIPLTFYSNILTFLNSLKNLSEPSKNWPRLKSKTDHCHNGSDWELTTKSDTMLREDTGEELSWVSKFLIQASSSVI